jgi:transcriptional regulator with XRE-family HTH domain
VTDPGEQLSLALAAEFARMRTAQGWSLAELAQRADAHRSTIHMIEQGKRGLSVAMAARIAAAFDEKLADVLTRLEARDD